MTSVLIVDDTALYRSVIAREVTAAGLEVIGKASGGSQALLDIERLKPDLVTLDLEMPDLPGIEVLRALRQRPMNAHRPLVVVFSAHSAEGAAVTLEALRLGAADFVCKPTSSDGLAAITERLIPTLRALAATRATKNPISVPPSVPARPPAAALGQPPNAVPNSLGKSPNPRLIQRRILAIAASTGGPPALETALPQLAADFPVPVLITQHMPPLFTKVLAESLAKRCRLKVCEATDGMAIRPGYIFIAPGGMHLSVVSRAPGEDPQTKLTDEPPIFGLRPAADIMFPSIGKTFGGAVLMAIFTGMGSDGTMGGKALKAAGGALLTQTKETCTVYGMPHAANEAGLADGFFTPANFADTLTAWRLAW
jgi:two-component system chemotaxis response regulator CheB